MGINQHLLLFSDSERHISTLIWGSITGEILLLKKVMKNLVIAYVSHALLIGL